MNTNASCIPVESSTSQNSKNNSGIFDRHIDDLMLICEALLTNHSVFHLHIDFPTDRLTCWRRDNPYDNAIFFGNTVFDPKLTDWFGPARPAPQNSIPKDLVWTVLKEIKRLRRREFNHLHQASINCVNGQIGLTRQQSGSQTLLFENFFAAIRGNSENEETLTCRRI